MDLKNTSQSSHTFRFVPLLPIWTVPGTKLDLKAIFRRPRRREGEFDEIIQVVGADGLPAWDLTGPLPLRRYADWIAKGYEYVTLADLKSLNEAASSLREAGYTPHDYMQHPNFGPWNPKLYAAVENLRDREKYEQILAHIEEFGLEAFEKISGTKVPPELVAAYEKRRAAAPAAPASAAPESPSAAAEPAPAAAGPAAPPVARPARKTKGKGKGKAPAGTVSGDPTP